MQTLGRYTNTLQVEQHGSQHLNELGDHVTRDSGNGEVYARRVPPVPATLMEGAMLKGTKIVYTQSL